jgi:hypothetical protein
MFVAALSRITSKTANSVSMNGAFRSPSVSGLSPWVDADEVAAERGEHVAGTLKIAGTDGGVTLGADDGDDDRPEDCDCSLQFNRLACWPCDGDGFETPNPHATGDDN